MAMIGLRCFPNKFCYVVLEGTQQKPVLFDKKKLPFPKNGTRGSHLRWLRKQIFEICETYSVEGVCIKRAEPAARTKSLERSEVEGVIKEAIKSKTNIECVPRIKSQLRRDIKGFNRAARYLPTLLDRINLGNLKNSDFEDAALAAIAELP